MTRSQARTTRDRLLDIVEWGTTLKGYVAGLDDISLREDKMRLHAVTKCIKVVGEASAQLLKPNDRIVEQFPDLDVKKAYAARNRLSHGYFDINPDLVWLTATRSIPAIVTAAKAALRHLDETDPA